MKKRVLNASLVLVAAVMLAVFAFYVRVGATADAVVVLRTSGMTCGSCVGKVTKALQGEKGVVATEVDLEGGVVIAGYDSKQVAPERLAQTVAATGFGSTVQAVLTPEQFRTIVGRNIGAQAAAGGCCGSRGCGGK
ncbi:MAG TPA: copper chaperone [Geobacter sp.]|nr:copper chaperone [Geobacter sp.]